MAEKVRTRFAPSPTGMLHLGGARTALFNWVFARKEKGVFILRIEDTDPARSCRDFEEAICEDLQWLGIDWDEGPYRQSERLSLYAEFLKVLQEKGLVYPCYCTQEELERERVAALEEGHPPRYSRRCLLLSPEERRRLEERGRKPSFRFYVPQGKTLVVRDLVRGEVPFASSDLADFVVVRSDGLPTYNFACVVDDALMGITHVLRGEEHLPNTPYQLLLYEALGFTPPLFAHVPVICDKDGAKLSKRREDTSLRFFREEGFLRDAIFNYLLTLGHSFPEGREVLPREELIALFDLGRVGRARAIFDPARLSWMNRVYLQNLPLEALREEVASFAGPLWADWERILGKERLLRLLLLFREEAKTLKDLVLSLKEAAREGEVSRDEDRNFSSLFFAAFSALPEDFFEDEEKLREELRRIQKESGVPPRIFYRTLRFILIGREEGPEVHRLLWAFGKERVLAKLKK
ncbi:MAG: glutamate--tRNA ligase [Candidatus Caldatribacterium sp.]|nr:glutamate--tRNA ligase [Candidatus Caldatribacterium sp.]